MKKFHFVYITTNLINGKQYVGDHSTDNLNDEYLGSGKPVFKNAIKKYGRENFKREILELFETKKEAFNAQEKYINIYKTHVSQRGYNISLSGGHGVFGGYISDETKKKISLSVSKSLKGRVFSEEHKKKLSEAGKNKIFTKEHKQKMSNSAKNRPSNRKGKKHSEETKLKISNAGKGRKHSEKTKLKFKNRIPWNKKV